MKKYILEKIDNNTYMISEKLGGVHTYLLVGKKSAVLIDTGNGAGKLNKVVRKITDLPVTVLNTHAHADHIGGNYMFSRCRISPYDQEVCRLHCDKSFLNTTFKNMVPFLLRPLAKMLLSYMFYVLPFEPQFDLNEGEIIDLGDRSLEVIAISGHTAGSVGFYERKTERLFVGDSIVKNRVLLNLQGCQTVEVYRNSLIKLQKTITENTLMFSGHMDSPIPYCYVEKFIACATAAMENKATFHNGKESGCPCTYADFDGVSIALPLQQST